MEWYKYQGAGNDFLIADNRRGRIKIDAQQIAAICDRRYGIGADGVMLLERGRDGYDFVMQYYNSDGSGGMMCGNGGRCIVAFAAHCGIKRFRFLAPDGPHEATVLKREGKTVIIRLKMKDVTEMEVHTEPRGTFIDTGTRHFVLEVSSVKGCDVVGIGRKIRYLDIFGPVGVNVNFIEPTADDSLYVRTYEKGVEDETYACGTGITASAIVNWHNNHQNIPQPLQSVKTKVYALRDELEVEFTPSSLGATEVYLTGPATYIAKIII